MGKSGSGCLVTTQTRLSLERYFLNFILSKFKTVRSLSIHKWRLSNNVKVNARANGFFQTLPKETKEMSFCFFSACELGLLCFQCHFGSLCLKKIGKVSGSLEGTHNNTRNRCQNEMGRVPSLHGRLSLLRAKLTLSSALLLTIGTSFRPSFSFHPFFHLFLIYIR